MALLWSKTVNGVRYEVRTAGRTRRLYTNGVLHSQFNSARPLTGSVWDLLMLPAFFFEPGSVRRVLVLGIGGGAVIRLLQHFVEPTLITGVELSEVHLSVAERFFGVSPGEKLHLHQGDAVQWLDAYDGAPFDLIVDDLFEDSAGEPQRAVDADGPWFHALRSILSPGGALVMNFASTKELSRSAWYADPQLPTVFPSGFRLSTRQNENAVAAFLPRSAESGELRRRLSTIPELDPRRASNRLRFSIRRLQAPGW